MDEIIIEPLGDHPRGAFCCDLERIDNFFKNNAFKSHQAYSQRVFVARFHNSDTPIGFYALTAQTFRPGMNDEADKKFGRHASIPTIYLTMIARDRIGSPKGLGAVLMQDAFERALSVRENVGFYALTLHAYNDKVAGIYEGFGFKPFASRDQDQDHGEGGQFKAMFMPLSDVKASLAAFDAAEG